jgi:ferredoxin
MPKKYHISIETMPPRMEPVGKYATLEFREDCAGSCRDCVKKKCVYGVFDTNFQHIKDMEEPAYLYACESCFRCVQECTKGIFSRVINPEYRTLGDDYWKPEIIHRTWYQAHTGKIPVSGAGYRGPFVGSGFDAMWTDMSEIVRPTRDGIHGREYINTSIELSRRVTPLQFKADMSLDIAAGPILEVPIPALLQLTDNLVKNTHIVESAVKAAHALDTLIFLKPADFRDTLKPYAKSMVPCLTSVNFSDYARLVEQSRMVEVAYESGVEKVFSSLRTIQPDLIISVGIALDARAADIAWELAGTEVDSLHFYADERGNEIDADPPRFLKEMIREVHLKLVENSVRQKFNLIFSGGIALAEHMAKAIICGADGIVADQALLVALECRLCYQCRQGLACPVKLDDGFDTDWGSQRIINLIGAWNNQLIEVMGAMGIREARRLRGEVGRSMWFEDLEKDNFGPIFGEKKVIG